MTRTNTNDEPRDLDAWERRLFEHLLSCPIPEARVFRSQVPRLRVTGVAADGYRALVVEGEEDVRAEARGSFALVSGYVASATGVGIGAVIHARDGLIYGLTLLRDDFAPIRELPDPLAFEILDHA